MWQKLKTVKSELSKTLLEDKEKTAISQHTYITYIIIANKIILEKKFGHFCFQSLEYLLLKF